MRKYKIFLAAALMAFGISSCSDEPEITTGETDNVGTETPDVDADVLGFYLLNEGNLGANKSTLDYYDYTTATYYRNIYAERNPSVVFELGDAGNDIAVYDGRLYIVVNGSHKVEVLDAETAARIGQVDISSPRSIAFDGDYAYVSSYVGGDGENGSVVRFELSSLKVNGSVSVGLMPEEIVITEGYLYVANSMNLSGTYDNKISIVRLSDFTPAGNIEVDVNLHRLRKDSEGNLWVSSRGNYYDIPSNLYKLTREGVNQYSAPKALNVECTNLAIDGEKLYYYATVYDANWTPTQQYGVINTTSATVIADSFITDGTDTSIATPYSIAVHPTNGDIYISDAANYVSSGKLFCYGPDGKLKWQVKTGDIPGHIAFLNR